VRTAKLLAAYNIVTKVVHFPLYPDTPVGGRSLEDLFQGGPGLVQNKNARMASLAAEMGLSYTDRTHTYNTRRAQELAKWAETKSGGEVFHDALFSLYFVDGRNLAETGTLLDATEISGLSRDEAQLVLDDRRFSDAVDADWAKALDYGVTTVPTYVIGGKGVVGAQSYEVIEALLRDAGAERRILN